MNEKINDLIKEHFKLKNIMDKTKEESDLVKAEIKLLLSEAGEDKYENEEGTIVSYKESERKSLDRKLVEKKLEPNVFAECFKVSSFSTLRIQSKEDRDRIRKVMKGD